MFINLKPYEERRHPVVTPDGRTLDLSAGFETATPDAGNYLRIYAAESGAATRRAAIEASRWGTAILAHAADYSGTSIGTVP